nr:helix-turn-helix transcriptional regulator [uncultured Pseudogulbenkiania sp.]
MPKRNLLKLSPLPIEARFALEALGERITQARKERRLSQREVAEMLGISKTTYISIEHGRDSAQIGHYARAVWLLDVPGTFLPVPEDDVLALEKGKP